VKYIGKYGEHFTLSNLLKSDIEAYMAIKSNQEDYDITVVLNETSVKRIQVKATELQNKNTNNSIDGTDKNYDFLILVIQDNDETRPFILTHEEAQQERGSSKKFSCSKSKKGVYFIKDNLLKYENQWQKITNV